MADPSRITLDYFYPGHYLKNIPPEILAMRHLNDYWFQQVLVKYNLILSRFLWGYYDPDYLRKGVQKIGVIYIDGCIPFMLKKKTPFTLLKLTTLIQECFGFPCIASLDGSTLSIRNRVIGDAFKLELIQSFLQSYLPLCVPSFFRIQIHCQYGATIHSMDQRVSTYNNKTISQLTRGEE